MVLDSVKCKKYDNGQDCNVMYFKYGTDAITGNVIKLCHCTRQREKPFKCNEMVQQ